MNRILLFLVIFMLSALAHAEFGYTMGGDQFFYNADYKFQIAENQFELNVYDSVTGKRIVREGRTPYDYRTCPLKGYGLVEFRQILRPDYKFFDYSLRFYDNTFANHKDVLLSSLGPDEATQVGICDLDSGRFISVSNPKGSNWQVPQRKLKVFNANSNTFEDYPLPESYWDSINIYDVAISEEQDLIAFLRSDVGGSGQMLDIRNFSTGKLVFRTYDFSKQDGNAKKLKFTDHGRRLIFDSRIIYDTQLKKKIYEAPDSKTESFWMKSLMIPYGNGQHLYITEDALNDFLRISLADEASGKEKFIMAQSVPTIHTLSLSKNKDKLVIAAFENTYEVDLQTGTSRMLFEWSGPDYMMYSLDDELVYVDYSKDNLIRMKH
jgi:hypothetical protein